MNDFMTLISFLLVPLIDLINSQVKNSQLRFWISALACLVVGFVVNFAKNQGFGGVESFSADVLTVFGLVQLVYKGMYEGGNMQGLIRSQGPASKS